MSFRQVAQHALVRGLARFTLATRTNLRRVELVLGNDGDPAFGQQETFCERTDGQRERRIGAQKIAVCGTWDRLDPMLAKVIEHRLTASETFRQNEGAAIETIEKCP